MARSRSKRRAAAITDCVGDVAGYCRRVGSAFRTGGQPGRSRGISPASSMRKSLFERPAQLRLTLPTNAQHRKALMSKYRVVFSSAAAIAVSLLAFVEPARADVGAEMEAEEQGGDVGDQMKADEAGGEGGATPESGNTNRGPRRRERASGPVGRFGTEDRFGAPTGPTGAGLALSPAQRGRFWGELGFHTQEALTVWVPVLGGGYKLSPNIELELILPFVYGSRDASNP